MILRYLKQQNLSKIDHIKYLLSTVVNKIINLVKVIIDKLLFTNYYYLQIIIDKLLFTKVIID